MLLTFRGRLIVKRLRLEKPNISRSIFGLCSSEPVFVIPRTNTGSEDGIALSRPRNVVITFSGRVRYQVSIAGR